MVGRYATWMDTVVKVYDMIVHSESVTRAYANRVAQLVRTIWTSNERLKFDSRVG